MEIYKKLAKAKAEIKATKIKKEGYNSFSKYKYFTPDQIEHLVASACSNHDLLTIFHLNRNEFGEYGVLEVVDTENGDSIQVTMATAIPEIKATNIAQQLGGCVTYTERYLKTSIFGITDNNLDFDKTPENNKKANAKPELELASDEFLACREALGKGYKIADIKKKYTLTKEVENALLLP